MKYKYALQKTAIINIQDKNLNLITINNIITKGKGQNKMVQIGICDDETQYIEKVSTLISEFFEKKDVTVFKVDTYSNGNNLISDIENGKKFDILFLDINMKDIDGISVAKIIRSKNEKVIIVFISAFLDYATEGYEVKAIRYLLKDRISQMFPECMDVVMKQITLNRRNIMFPFREGPLSINIDNICYISSNKHILYFYINDAKELLEYTVYDKLDIYEEKLNEFGFIRLHKSYLVNIKYIKKISNYVAVLTNNIEVPVPKIRYQYIKDIYFRKKGEV